MATKRLPRPRDPIALAKLNIATGLVVNAVEDGKGVPTPGRGRLMEGRDKRVSRLYKLISAALVHGSAAGGVSL